MVLIEQDKRIADDLLGNSDGKAQSGYALAARPTALRQVLSSHVSLAIWQRRLGDDIDRELAGLVLDEVDDILFACELCALDADLARAMEKAGYPDMPALEHDITMLARQHAALTDDRKVRIRLEVVETDACRKFHADYVKVRTITTYRGQGTQWIVAPSADRLEAGDGPPIKQLDAGHVGVFKGRLWKERPTILHRSPPIGDSGEQRLVLVIDPAPAEEKIVRMGAACA